MRALSETERLNCEKASRYLRARGYVVMHQMATINQIIDVLGVSAPHITNLVERGDFPKPYDVACKAFSQGIPRGRKSLRFSVPEVQEWLDKRREEV